MTALISLGLMLVVMLRLNVTGKRPGMRIVPVTKKMSGNTSRSSP